MKSPSERGVIGAWAYAARTELDLSVEQVAERVAARGQVVSPATIRGIESGAKKPGARLLRLLGMVLESTPPGVERQESTLSYEERHLALLEEANAIARERLEQERVISSALMALLRQGSGRPDLVEQARTFAESLGHTPLTPLGDPTPSPGR